MQIYNNYLHIILYESKKFESKTPLLEIKSKGKFHRIVIKRLFITFRTHKRVHRSYPTLLRILSLNIAAIFSPAHAIRLSIQGNKDFARSVKEYSTLGGTSA